MRSFSIAKIQIIIYLFANSIVRVGWVVRSVGSSGGGGGGVLHFTKLIDEDHLIFYLMLSFF